MLEVHELPAILCTYLGLAARGVGWGGSTFLAGRGMMRSSAKPVLLTGSKGPADRCQILSSINIGCVHRTKTPATDKPMLRVSDDGSPLEGSSTMDGINTTDIFGLKHIHFMAPPYYSFNQRFL